MKIKPNKLVRDKIPQIIKDEKRELKYRKISGEELDKEIRKKLQEELDEVLEADNKKNKTEELADLLTIMKKFAENEGISWGEVENEFHNKGSDKGLFNNNYKLLEFDKESK